MVPRVFVGGEVVEVAEGHRYRLRLVVVAGGELVLIVDVVVEFQIFLIARLKIHHTANQVVAARLRWVGIGQGQGIDQYLAVGVDSARFNNAAGWARAKVLVGIAIGCDRAWSSGCPVCVVHVETLQVRRVAEVTGAHVGRGLSGDGRAVCGRNRFANVEQWVLHVLQVLFVGGEEKEFVPLLIEVGPRNNYGTANVGAQVVIAVVGLGQSQMFYAPVGVIERMVANGAIEFAVEVLAAGFSLRLHDDRPARVLRGERRGDHLELLDHFHVGGDGGGAGGVDVGDGGAVAHDLGEVKAIAVHAVGAAVRSKAGDLAAVGVTFEIARVCRARHQTEQFDGAASHDVQVLDLLIRKSVGNLASRLGGDRGRSRGDGDRLTGSFYRQMDVGNFRVVGDMHDNGAAQFGKAGLVKFHLISGGSQTGEGKEAVRIAGGLARRLGRGVGQSNGSADNYGAA